MGVVVNRFLNDIHHKLIDSLIDTIHRVDTKLNTLSVLASILDIFFILK